MNLPSRDSATGKGIFTGIQAFFGTVVVVAGALWAAINGVPGCSDAVFKVIQDNFVLIVTGLGVSSGLASGFFGFVMNYLRKDVKNY